MRAALEQLLRDETVPPAVRRELDAEYRDLEQMLDKLEHGHLHIAVFGRVGVGKSSLLNALVGEPRFYTSALHGATERPEAGAWVEYAHGRVILYDTPGINEIDGAERERMAHEVATRADLVLFVVEADLTDSELSAFKRLLAEHKPLLLVLNKADRYTGEERALLLDRLMEHTRGLIPPENVVTASAAPHERIYLLVDEQGREREERRRPPPEVDALRERLWTVLEREGKTLLALNAGLFAGAVSDRITARIMQARRTIAQRVIRQYCVAKGVAVALNPVPVTDLAAAAGLDVALTIHLSRIYGLPMTRREAAGLVRTIAIQASAVMGTAWALNLASSALKLGSGGLSTAVTAGAQGAVAYYATVVVGRAAEHYLAQGKAWGESGPKRAVQRIVAEVDRASVLAEAREAIARRLSRVGMD